MVHTVAEDIMFGLGVVHKLHGQPGWVGGSEKAQILSTFTMVTVHPGLVGG